jgi:uncharacterized lipoprotein YddW (UPF0748 family)
MRIIVALLLLFAHAAVRGTAEAQVIPDSVRGPEPMREFRAIWVATVGNMDWPSRPDLSPEAQREELIAILERAAQLNMNAIVFQVRPEADALYASTFEPWSRFLTGVQGKAPDPVWDPLEFAVTEAHKRGLELHAWFNPYRAAYRRDAPAARNHISKRRPDLVVPYGQFLWMDPGISEVRRLMVRTVLDVVRRYDIDGVHIDDYFYPYPETSNRQRVDFPDAKSFAAYRRHGGKLSKSDWRRQNVNQLIRELYAAVKGQKMWVKVGISPFGIWRPGHPPSIQAGIDTYDELYADSRKWLLDGSLDYIAPQLYWPVQPPEQSYPIILQWWVEQNTKGRHIWPGLALYKIPLTGPRRMTPQDIVQEIEITRDTPGATGHIHFNTKVLMQNVAGIADRLAEIYDEPALVPASPWLDKIGPDRPIAAAARGSAAGIVSVRFTPQAREAVTRWVVQTRSNGNWSTHLVAGPERRLDVPDPRHEIDLLNVSSVDRNGNLSVPAVIRPR